MSKYKKCDKLVIRKDLVVGELYGDIKWWIDREYLKEKDYVIIEEVDTDGDYWIEGGYICINDEIIEGLYEDDKLYYIKLVGNGKDVLHISDWNNHTFEMVDDLEYHKCKFTENESDDIIGSSKILYKELV